MTWVGSSRERSDSLFEAPAQSTYSDLKFRLHPRDKTHFDSLRGFPILETLDAQVGPSIGHGTDSGDDNDDDSSMYPDSNPDNLPFESSVLVLKINAPLGEHLSDSEEVWKIC
jgi:hypothetical protein